MFFIFISLMILSSFSVLIGDLYIFEEISIQTLLIFTWIICLLLLSFEVFIYFGYNFLIRFVNMFSHNVEFFHFLASVL